MRVVLVTLYDHYCPGARLLVSNLVARGHDAYLINLKRFTIKRFRFADPGEMKECRFGANCLVASFAIEGFDTHPGRFVCVYPNSRRDFTFNGDRVDDACVTADPGDTLAIEVAGVTSATISEDDLEGSGPPP